jgi:GNAT superfamily N-acetyltransferase
LTQLDFDPLTVADLEAALALSTEAGWNQTAADWRRLLDLSPRGCLAGRVNGALVATATSVVYGPEVRWIGMVLVARAWRGRGFGTVMLRTIVGQAAAGLDATDLGRPLYLGLGFADVAPIDRWVGTLRPGPAGGVEPVASFAEVASLDRRACEVDRTPLLAHLAREPEVTGWVAREGARCVGFAWLRPGREHWHLGPVVCDDAVVLRRLLSGLAHQLDGRSVLVDVVRDEARSAVLAASGLRVQRRLTRMLRPQAPPMLMGPRIAAATSFEWG